MNARYFRLCVLLAVMMFLLFNLIAVTPAITNTQIDATQVFTYLPLILKPTVTPTPPPIIPTPLPTLLASNQAGPNSLVVDSQTVYWANRGTEDNPPDGTIMALSKSQGISQTLASGLSYPILLRADTDSLFWSNRQGNTGLLRYTIFRMPKSGGQPVELTSYEAVNPSLAVDETYVYWRAYDGVVMRLAKIGGGTPEPAPVPALVFDGPDAYWLNSNKDLIQSGKDGSSAITLVRGSDLAELGGREYSMVYITGIFPKPSEIYFKVFVDNNPGMGSCTDQSVVLMKIPKGGGEYRQVARVAGGGVTLVAEPFVYFSGYCTNGILKIALDTQTGETVAAWPGLACALADDAMYVYWADCTNGWITRVDK